MAFNSKMWGGDIQSVIGGIAGLVLILTHLTACEARGERQYQYVSVSKEMSDDGGQRATLSICLPAGRKPKQLSLTARYDHRISLDYIDLELSLHRWGRDFARDTIRFAFDEYLRGQKGRRPLVYNAQADRLWQITPPIAGVYEIRFRPLPQGLVDGLFAIGVSQVSSD